MRDMYGLRRPRTYLRDCEKIGVVFVKECRMIGTTILGPRRCLRSSCYYDTLSSFFRVELHRCGNVQGPRHTWKDPCGGCELADRLVGISPAAPNPRPLRARNRNVQQGSSPLTAVEASTGSSSVPGASYADAKLTRCLHKRQVWRHFFEPALAR